MGVLGDFTRCFRRCQADFTGGENALGRAMNSSLSPVRPRRRGLVSKLRRAAARVAAWAGDPQRAPVLAIGFTIAHVVLWTAILTELKAAQDVHFDVAEAYAWGQKFLLGYGKHPPLSGWIA